MDQNILDYAKPFYYGDATILASHVHSYVFSGLDLIKIWEDIAWIILPLLFMLTIITMVIFYPLFFKANEIIFERISNVFIIVFGSFLGKGK